jgi:hypothetical protein
MNEKLKELATKAKLEHCVSHVRLQEFADLIVEECCNTLSKEDLRHGGYGYNLHGLYGILRKQFESGG